MRKRKQIALLIPPIRALYEQRNALALRVQTLAVEVERTKAELERTKADALRVLTLTAELERIKAERIREALLSTPPNYARYHALVATSYQPVDRLRVLVIGCNRGDDCRYFVEFGAATVVGLDVLEEVGINFAHNTVSYSRASAVEMPFRNGAFDVIFCFATMEHISDIKSAFSEMVRVSRPGGLIYSIAAPLWNSRQGPHWGDAFDDYPWIHLRLPLSDIVAFSESRREGSPNTSYLSPKQLSYFTDARHFNKHPARYYLDICSNLNDVDIIRNDIEEERGEGVDQSAIDELTNMGYDRRELFGLTHTFIAKPR